jgi:hypothetical protein
VSVLKRGDRKFKVREGTQVAIGGELFAAGETFTVPNSDDERIREAELAVAWGWATEPGAKPKEAEAPAE